MARKAHFPPKVHRHKTGQARCHWKGRDHYLGPFGSAEAEAAYRQLVARIAAGELDAPPPALAAAPPAVLVADVVAAYLGHLGGSLGGRSREAKQSAYSFRPLLALFGALAAADFRAPQLEELQRAMASGSWAGEEYRARQARRGQGAGWSRGVVNRRTVRVQTCWRWAERSGLVPPGSHAHLCSVPGLRGNARGVRSLPPRRPATLDDLDAVLPHVQRGRRYRPVAAMLRLQALVGMRSCEVRMMRGEDIDRSGPVWLYRPRESKMDYAGQERVVPLGPECQAVLAPWLASRPRGCLFPCREGGEKPYTDFAYAQAVRRAARRAGVGLQPYQLRHGAKQRVTRELGLDAARALLGQRSLGTTNGYAAGADLELAARAAARLA